MENQNQENTSLAEKILGKKDEFLWKEFEFAEHQLGVVDAKANNVLMVDSVLIIIATLSAVFDTDAGQQVKMLATIGTIFVLVSVVFCLRTIWVNWADNFEKIKQIKELRDKKTKVLHVSVSLLFVSLAFYVAMFIVDYFVRFPVK